MKAILIILFIIIYIVPASAITTADLPRPISNETEKIIENISPIESFCSFWAPSWNHSISKDSVTRTIYNAIGITKKLKVTPFEKKLLEGILWHYLYQLDVDSAFEKSINLSDKLIKEYPNNFEGPWLKGISLIKGANLKSGFTLMESIRAKNDNLPQEFFKDYIKLSELVFLPEILSNLKEGSSVIDKGLQFKIVDLKIDERFPVSRKWTVTSESSLKDDFPMFRFSADFNLKKSFKINLPKIGKKKFSMKIPLKKEFQKELKDPLIFDPDAPPIKMNLNVMVEALDGKGSIESYMFNKIYKQFDIVKPIKTDNNNMIIIKCFNKATMTGMDDKYIAYIAFDKPLERKDIKINPRKHNKTPKSGIRYVIGLSTSASVESKADTLLYEIARKISYIK